MDDELLRNQLSRYTQDVFFLLQESAVMSITAEATYESGQLRFKQPIALAEGTQVRVVITPLDEDHDPLDAVIGIGEGPPDGADNHDKYIYGKIRP
jgi:predicted DNA-binding antitoxin AbrB/MazE fold protein